MPDSLTDIDDRLCERVAQGLRDRLPVTWEVSWSASWSLVQLVTGDPPSAVFKVSAGEWSSALVVAKFRMDELQDQDELDSWVADTAAFLVEVCPV